MNKNQQGFTLVELAVAIFLLALILGSLLVPLATQVERRQYSDTEKVLEEIREALYGYAIANGNLPCPDTNNDGVEDFTVASGLCTTLSTNFAIGNLPWQTLGVAPYDVRGNRFRYMIREEYARRSPNTAFTLTTTSANIRVCSVQACTPAANVLTTTAVAVILSYGKNGLGATQALTGNTNPNPASADELENTDTDRDIVSRIATESGATAGEFDDVVTWLPLYTLFNKMVTSGKLP